MMRHWSRGPNGAYQHTYSALGNKDLVSFHPIEMDLKDQTKPACSEVWSGPVLGLNLGQPEPLTKNASA